MPLNTQIVRDGEPLSLHWGDFHIAAMVCAASWDSGEGPFETNRVPEIKNTETGEVLPYPETPFPITRRDAFDLAMYPVLAATPLNSGPYTLTGEHRFVDVTDGEVLELKPGDVLRAFRS